MVIHTWNSSLSHGLERYRPPLGGISVSRRPRLVDRSFLYLSNSMGSKESTQQGPCMLVRDGTTSYLVNDTGTCITWKYQTPMPRIGTPIFTSITAHLVSDGRFNVIEKTKLLKRKKKLKSLLYVQLRPCSQPDNTSPLQAGIISEDEDRGWVDKLFAYLADDACAYLNNSYISNQPLPSKRQWLDLENLMLRLDRLSSLYCSSREWDIPHRLIFPKQGHDTHCQLPLVLRLPRKTYNPGALALMSSCVLVPRFPCSPTHISNPV